MISFGEQDLKVNRVHLQNWKKLHDTVGESHDYQMILTHEEAEARTLNNPPPAIRAKKCVRIHTKK